jgi:hypothetical protein
MPETGKRKSSKPYNSSSHLSRHSTASDERWRSGSKSCESLSFYLNKI